MHQIAYTSPGERKANTGILPWRGTLHIAWLLILCWGGAGCSTMRTAALNQVGDSLAGSGTAFASDDDPEFIRLASPFSLKMMEVVLEQNPNHQGLLHAASKGFTQYAYAFIQHDADVLEQEDIHAAMDEWKRAQAMFIRGRNYGLRGLEVSYPDLTAHLRSRPREAAGRAGADDVPMLYWTACAWAGAISLAKDDPHLIADLPQVDALIDRAFELDPTFDQGAIHQFLISYESVRVDREGDPAMRSREHMERALELSGGALASPLVSFAETVSVKRQDREEFETLLRRALAIDPDARPEWRLTNLVVQRRARWLLSRVDDLFLDISPPTTEGSGL